MKLKWLGLLAYCCLATSLADVYKFHNYQVVSSDSIHGSSAQNAKRFGYDKANLEEIRQQALQGNATAQMYLSSMYTLGIKVPKDEAQSAYWSQQAANQGHPIGQANVAEAYAKGQGGYPKDEKKAFHWYLLSAKQGFAPAQESLGNAYRLGLGTTKDMKQALYWYNQACRQGFASACKSYNRYQ